MKKILALAVGMLLIPFTAFGMDMMSDGEMDSITGQSGVAISLQNIQIYTTGGEETWFRAGSDFAAVGLVYGDTTASYTFITAIKDMNTFDGAFERGDYQALIDGDLTWDGATVLDEAPDLPRVLSIRTLSGSDQANMFGAANPGFIEIGLPTVEIVGAAGSSEELIIYVGSTTAANASPVGTGGSYAGMQSIGTLYMGNSGSTTAILGGVVGITSAAYTDALMMDY